MEIWMTDREVYDTILRDQGAFVDAASYVCTQVKHGISTGGKPIRVYLSQLAGFRTASSYQEIRAALHGPVAETCSPSITLFGLITSVSAPISTLFGFQQQCNACGCASAPNVAAGLKDLMKELQWALLHCLQAHGPVLWHRDAWENVSMWSPTAEMAGQ